jgi:hypothetical protein
MLVQKQAPKKLKWLLIAAGTAVVLAAGYFIYDKLSSSSKDTTEDALVKKRQELPKDFGQKLFKDSRFFNLLPTSGTDLVEQTKFQGASDGLPAPAKLQAFDMQSGNSILFTWQKPAGLTGATAIRIGLSNANSVDNVITLKPDEVSYIYSSAAYNQERSYLVYYLNQTIAASSDQFAGKAGVVSGNIQVTTNDKNEIVLSWENPDNPNIKKIEIYRSDTIGVLGKMVESNNSPDFSEYVDFGSKPDLYFYKINWLEDTKIGSTAQVSVIATDSTVPEAPANLTAKYDQNAGGIKLEWSPSVSNDVVSYEIYRSTVKDVLGQKITTVLVEKDKVENQSLESVDKMTTSSSTVFYSVVAVDANGNKSTQQTLGVPGNANPFGEQ